MNPKAVLEFAAANNVKIVDIRFTDLPGLWQHVSFPVHELRESSFEDGFGMDGSSIRGWAAIHESDMLLVPDPSWYMLDPFTETPTLAMIGDIIDPVTKQHYVKDPRNIAKKAENYLAYTGIADTAYFGAEAEFFIFDNIRFDRPSNTVSTILTLKKAAGTPAGRRTTWVTGRATRKAISPSRPPTITRTCAAKWFWPWRRPGFKSSATTTKWPPAGKPRLTRGSTRC